MSDIDRLDRINGRVVSAGARLVHRLVDIDYFLHLINFVQIGERLERRSSGGPLLHHLLFRGLSSDCASKLRIDRHVHASTDLLL